MPKMGSISISNLRVNGLILAEAVPPSTYAVPSRPNPDLVQGGGASNSHWATQNHHLKACRKGLSHFAKGETEAPRFSPPHTVTHTEPFPSQPFPLFSCHGGGFWDNNPSQPEILDFWASMSPLSGVSFATFATLD